MSRTRTHRSSTPAVLKPTGLGAVAAAAVVSSLLMPTPAQAATGRPVEGGAFAHTARLAIGDAADARACSATVVDQWWVASAASCFTAADGRKPAAGKPALKTTVTLKNGKSGEVVELVPHADRDLVLARLAAPATDIAPVKRASSAPAAGSELTAVGHGRTKTEWVPAAAHSAAFTAGATDTTSIALVSKGTDALCKGDTGGPVLNQAGELVAISSRSWQGGCLGETETRTGALATRVDDLGQWIDATIDPLLVRPGQTIPSGSTLVGKDLKLVMQADGNMVIYHKSGGDGKGAAIWDTKTYGNPGAYAVMQEDGNFLVYKKDGGDGKGGSLWSSDTYGNGTENRGAYLRFQEDGNLVVYKKDGGPDQGGAIWASGSYRRANVLTSGTQYQAPFWIDAETKIFYMDRGGRLVIWDKSRGKELWTSNAYGGDGSHLAMQADGNFILYKKDGGDGKGGSVWSTATFANPGAYAHFQSDGNLVVYKKDGGQGKGGAIWHSDTWR
ncbi:MULTISPECIES: trypsin-like serine protease [unclassified Streptomyces]|uniref:trypsin-like serine protease n=1 Tax=unclassified Streptomyces TaxID=2593676 RepID=UPI00333113A4